VRRCSGLTPFRTEGGAPTPKPGFSYIQTGGPSRTVGAPAPGAKVLWLDTLFAPRAGAPTPKPGFSYTQTGIFSNRRSTRPGCEGVLVGLPFRTEGGAPTPKPGFSYIKPGFS